MSKKGVSLPVNVLVVLAIAIVVLLGVIAFFSGSLTPTREKVTSGNLLKTCCISYRQAGCPDVSISGDTFTCPNGGNLKSLAGNVGVITYGPNDKALDTSEETALGNYCNCP